jgi:hypothetical protein
MIISDLSYLEIAEDTNIEGSANSAYVGQVAIAEAGNNKGYYNTSYGNTAVAINISNIDQFYIKKFSFKFK